MNSAAARYAGLSKVLAAFVVLALLAAVFLLFTNGGREKTMVADFKVANSLYNGNEVRVMGVPVGRITKIEPQGDHVRVTLNYDSDVKLPADAMAVVVSPSIVGDRFVQLGPAYTGGATLPDNARLGLDRTAVPVELDDIFKSVDNLALALGPQGANKDGALSRLVNSTAEQFDGQGAQLAETLKNFARLSQTLDNNDEQLFSSIREIDGFVDLLHRNDDDVRDFFDSTAKVSKVLAGERKELADTIKALSAALIDVRDFVRDNRTALRGNVDNLERLARILANRSDQIDKVLAEAPTALADLGAAGGSKNGTLEARADLAELVGGIASDPVNILCNILNQAPVSPGGLCQGLTDILDLLPPGLLGGGAPSLGASTGTTSKAEKTSTSSTPAAGQPKSLVPGLDSVVGNLAGMLAVK
jgi:phospholipid/cholesterol/gamma-HCH transport system substrate-binding protein